MRKALALHFDSQETLPIEPDDIRLRILTLGAVDQINFMQDRPSGEGLRPAPWLHGCDGRGTTPTDR